MKKSPDPRDRENLHAIVSSIVSETLGLKSRSLNSSTTLVSSQKGFSSFAMLELVLKLESRFSIEILDEELDPDIFETIESISNFIVQKMDTKSA